jgi:hypothetical protein
MNEPERIYLMSDGDDVESPETEYIRWSPERMDESDVEYVRADIHAELLEALKNLYDISEPFHHDTDAVWRVCKKQVLAAIKKAEAK